MDKSKKKIRPSKDFKESERKSIIEEYLSGGISKADIWRKYTGYDHDHGGLLRWMRELGYENKVETKAIFAPQPFSITLDSIINLKTLDKEELQNRVVVLEKQLLEDQIKAEGYLLMIDIAEEEFKIPIQKKSDSK